MRLAAGSFLSVAGLAILTSACANSTPPNPEAPTSRTPVTAMTEPIPSLPVDPTSAELVADMAPNDVALVGVESTSARELGDVARSHGFVVELFDRASTLTIEGPLDPVLEGLRGAPLTSVTVSDPLEALRPIPDRRPTADVPTPDRPYVGSGFALSDLGAVAISGPQREPMLRSLALAIQTIDGRPYARIRLEGSCSSTTETLTCEANAVGFAVAAGQHEDSLSITGTAATGFAAAPVPGSGLWTSVPRRIVRDAEWIGRHDEAALARIRSYATFAWASWDPHRAGRITVAYERPCDAGAEPAGRSLADTGECFDLLSIEVDLLSGSVTKIAERAGP